jgi:hypothetical protein
MVVGVFPIDYLWNWWVLLRDYEAIKTLYVIPPANSLLENEIWGLWVTLYGVIAGVRVLRRTSNATSTALIFLWCFLAYGILTSSIVGVIQPIPALRAVVDHGLIERRSVGKFIHLITHLATFAIFLYLFKRRAKTGTAAQLA